MKNFKFRYNSRDLRRWRKLLGYQSRFFPSNHICSRDHWQPNPSQAYQYTDLLSCMLLDACVTLLHFPIRDFMNTIFCLSDGPYLCACSFVGCICAQNTTGHKFLVSLCASPVSVCSLRLTSWRRKTGRPWAEGREMGLWSLEPRSTALVSLLCGSTLLPEPRPDNS